uniref:Uncharacterized protein n=1 Tax=Lepeophtheirus salmonis TaxID=72036 RepID=A0A0K2TKL5_LEPSM
MVKHSTISFFKNAEQPSFYTSNIFPFDNFVVVACIS